jgi:ABC-type transport system involved in multi-copper enzyme maturation permease subunit
MADPIMARELVATFRTRRVFLLQCGLICLFAGLVIVRWPSEQHVALAGTRSQDVFRLFAYGLLTTMLLLLPVFPATNIVREKNRGTLALLFNTPLGPWRIYAGKFLAVLGLAGVVLILSLPAAAACYALGGLSLTAEFPKAYLVLALTALECAALGLCVSSYSNSLDEAVRWTYGLLLFVSVLSLGPHQFFQGSEGILADLGQWLRCLSPYAAMMSILGSGDVAAQGLQSSGDVARHFVVGSAIVTLVATVATVARLNHRIFDRSRAQGAISDDQSLAVRALRRVVFIVDPQRRARGIGWLVNPVMIKEFRCRRFGRLHWLLRLVAACAILSLALTYATTQGTLDWGVETIGGILVFMQVALLVLITPSLAAGLISGERETGGWTLLLMTPLSVYRILWGKLLSVILTLVLVLCATLPGYLVMVYIEPGLRFQVERVVICLAATAGFAMLLSAAVGSLFRRTAPATATAYAALLTVCAAPLLVWMGRDAPFGHAAVEAALSINPIAAALSVIRTPGFQDYDLLPANWWFMGIASAVSIVLLVVQTRNISRPQ